jgi:DNA topoisomerase-1
VQREREIREFVPVPYWKATGVFERNGKKFTAGYAQDRIETKAFANEVKEECAGKEAVAIAVRRSTVQVGPPVPFNTGDLQMEAYRVFRFTPSKTLQIAEWLYLGALISYPRTGSQSLPSSTNCRRILQGIGTMPQYATYVAELLKTELRPTQGTKSDPAHPAIYPTGEKPRRVLDSAGSAIFDLVTRRFLAAFGPSARRDLADVTLAAGKHEFRLAGGRTTFPGWMRYYGRYSRDGDVELPTVSQGDGFRVVDVQVDEKFDRGPSRYNQSSLLEKMEREGIGTKATRAEIIATLVARGYVAGEGMEVTDLGLSVVETMARYAPSIISTDLTRGIEERLEAVEEGSEGDAPLMRETVRSIASQLTLLGDNEEAVSREIGSALARSVARSFTLGGCPVCRTGELKIVRSKVTKKRFVGCSNYPSGCRASAPLPQRGTIRATSKACEHCSWPIVYVLGGRRPWRFCVNPECQGKRKP